MKKFLIFIIVVIIIIMFFPLQALHKSPQGCEFGFNCNSYNSFAKILWQAIK